MDKDNKRFVPRPQGISHRHASLVETLRACADELVNKDRTGATELVSQIETAIVALSDPNPDLE